MVAPLNSKNNQETTIQKKTTMKINRFKVTFILLSTFASVALSGCSNEDNIESQPQEGMAKISFKINEKDYEAGEDVAGTRAAAPTKPELQDLGDGWMAEVSLEPDTTHAKEAKAAEAKTRAIYGSAHYTIQAYQGGVKKGELKGTFQGSTFTPDAGTAESIFLPHGTYDFVCFNDKVSANGTQFTVNRADAGTARFTVQRGVVINQDPKQYVAFEMKHAGASVNVNLHFVNCNIKGVYTNIVYMGMTQNAMYEPKDPAEKLKYKVETAANKIPETMIYDFATDSYTYPTTGQISRSLAVQGIQGGYASIGSETYIPADNNYWDYWLPTTDCANLNLTFTFGELYGRSLVGKTITVPTHKQVEANKQYRVVIKVLMGYMYLFSDGTAGPLANNPGKTPVGVVVDPYRRIAVALHDAQPTYYGSNKWSISTNSDGRSATSYKDLFDPFSNNRGEVTSSYPYSNYPATELARNYYQTAGYGVSGGASGFWYVPSLEDFLIMGVSLGKLPNQTSGSRNYPNNFSYLIPTNAPATGFGASVVFPSMDMTRFNKAFTDVGGTAPSGSYWTSNECQDGGNYMQGTMFIGAGYSFQLTSKTNTAQVRPFIRY